MTKTASELMVILGIAETIEMQEISNEHLESIIVAAHRRY